MVQHYMAAIRTNAELSVRDFLKSRTKAEVSGEDFMGGRRCSSLVLTGRRRHRHPAQSQH